MVVIKDFEMPKSCEDCAILQMFGYDMQAQSEEEGEEPEND